MKRDCGVVLVICANQKHVAGLFAETLEAAVSLLDELRKGVIVRVALKQGTEFANCRLSVLEQDSRDNGDQLRVAEIGHGKRVQANRLARFCMQPDISGMEQGQQ